jgi:hypothetical protein
LPTARKTWLIAALLALATLAIYSPALQNGFVQFDDPAYVTANAHVQQGLTWPNVAWAFTSFDEANWHPLTWLSHMADVQLYGLTPAGHHRTSIIFHALNAAFLFLLLQRGTGCTWRSLVVAALFALHPLNVENVAWIAERKSLLCMFFSLAMVALYARYVRAPRWTRYLTVVVAFAAALASKPMAITLPVLLLLLDYWPLRRFAAPSDVVILSGGRAEQRASAVEESLSTPRLRALILEKLPLFAMSAASSIITIVAQKRGHAVSDLVHLPLSERLANAVVATVTYARRTLWPNDLSYFYPHPGAGLSTWKVVAAVVLLTAITLFVIRFRERRHLVVGWFLFLIALLPVIGILQVGIQAMADRYAYLPTVGIFIAIIWELGDLFDRLRISPAISAALAIAALASLPAVTITTEHYWYDSLTLFTRAHQVAQVPNSYIETNYAAALLDHHRDAEALEHFRLAAKLAPDDFIPHYNVGYLLAQQQDFGAAAAEYREALRCAKHPEARARVLFSLGITYLNWGDRRQAADAIAELLQIQPNNQQARSMLDSIHEAR